MGGASIMGTSAIGGITVETIVMREDVVSLKALSVYLV